jgi:hypothetical protein
VIETMPGSLRQPQVQWVSIAYQDVTNCFPWRAG